MGKLTNLKPQLTTLRSVVTPARDQHGHSRVAEPWRNWYSLKRWLATRRKVFVRDLFTCQMQGCGRMIADTSKLVADHKTPHRGDPRLFWDEDNVHTLCTWCHSSLKQAEEKAGG